MACRSADIIFLNGVKLLLVFSHPPRNLVSRTFSSAENAFLRLTGRRYRSFAHPPEAMLAVLRDHGLTAVHTQRGPVWHVEGLERQAA